MTGPASVEDTIRRLVEARLPLAIRREPLTADTALGRTGLGLDSVGIVEILLDCEMAFDLPFPPALFDEGPLTLGRLIAHALRTAAARS